jgi:amidase
LATSQWSFKSATELSAALAAKPGLPATVIPLGLTAQGFPVGVQIVGPWLQDRTPLKLAELIERKFGGFVPPPMFDD